MEKPLFNFICYYLQQTCTFLLSFVINNITWHHMKEYIPLHPTLYGLQSKFPETALLLCFLWGQTTFPYFRSSRR